VALAPRFKDDTGDRHKGKEKEHMLSICGTKAGFNVSEIPPQPLTGAADSGQAKDIEVVLRRAYKIHREHGGIFGYDWDDWIEAWQRPE
jgi:hypothetical protein